MSTKSNFWLVVVAFFFISSNAKAQLYGDVIDVNGQNNIGIGTNAPTSSLHIRSTSNPVTLRLQQQISNNYYGGIWDFKADTDFSLDYTIYNYGQAITGTAFKLDQEAIMGKPTFYVLEKSSFAKEAVFTNNIGIGVSTPTHGIHMKMKDIFMENYFNQKAFEVTMAGKLSARELNVIDGNGTVVNFRVTNKGFVRARQIDVDLSTIPDYVFETNYNLMPLDDLAAYLKANKHLPNIKSAKEYETAGSINIGELQLQLLEKVEELTLYILQQQKEVEFLKKENENIRLQLTNILNSN